MIPSPLADVLRTDELDRRPARPPDYRAENEALRELLGAFGRRPEAGLQRLVEVTMTLCGAESAGLSVAEYGGVHDERLCWWATAGGMAPLNGTTFPRRESPSGVVMDEGATMLFERPTRAFPRYAAAGPPIVEALLTPFYSEGELVGVLWVQSHGGGRPFDAEDRRILESLTGFAGAAWTAEVRRRIAEADRSKYQTLFNSIDQGFCVFEVLFDDAGKAIDYRFLEVNPAFEAHTGLRTSDVLSGATVREFIPEIGEHWFEIYGRVAKTGVPARIEERAGGIERWFDVQAFRIGGEGSSVVGAVFTDVSHQREVEKALARERERLNALLENAPAFTALMEGPELRFEFVNEEYRKLIGHRDVIGKRLREAVPEVAGQGYFEIVEGVLATGEPFRGEELPLQLQREPGGELEERYVSFVFQAVRDGDGTAYGVFAHGVDVTRGVLARKAIAEREEQFRTVFEQAPDDAIIVTDAARVVTAWNPAAERICGWTESEALGRSADMIFTPEDRVEGAPAREAAVAAREGKVVDERWHVRKEGSCFWASGTMNALHDEEGGICGYLKVFRDATERREAEETLREAVSERTAELQHAMKESEGFNYSIAHDLRSPLRAMAATSSILLEDLGPGLDDEHRELLVRQNENATRMGRLIDELLRLSRLARVEVKREPIDVSALAQTVFDDLAAQERTNGCRFEVQPGMTANADPGLVRMVLHNLIGNACKYSPHGGTIRVREQNGEFAVSDEGVGFDMRFAHKLFLPFERLVSEAEFEGTGIGLANVERIVGRHGGRVWPQSERGKGSTFTFTLG